MKKIIIMGILALSFNQVQAQFWNGTSNTTSNIYRSGNVGIGISSSPAYNLHVGDGASSTGAKALFGGTTLIGVSSPSTASSVLELQSTGASIYSLVSNISGADNDVMWIGTGTTAHTLYLSANGSLVTKRFGIFMESSTGNIEALTIWPEGQVGIGTATTSLGVDTKLAVEGLISCRELKVLPTSISWPDYVFADDYKRKSLEEVEQYINENKHLPQFSSAKQIEKDGYKIGETQTKMLEALEELYLHVIELKNENKQLRKEISDLKK